MGPTAAGKTDIAISLAKKFPIEIISVDSAMIYKDMDIGTGKPTKEELKIAPHHLIDIISPEDSYSVADFCDDCVKIMDTAIINNKIPVLVGGTMMYYKALQHGLSKLPSSTPELRHKLTEELNSNGIQHMYEKLQKLDPVSAKRINTNDTQRILRALEVNILTNKTMDNFFETNVKKLDGWAIKNIAILPSSRQILHESIKERFLKMLEIGFVEEVIELRKKYNLSSDLPSVRSIGYRQVFNYLDNEYDYEVMVEKATASTRQLAKRQYTWLRSWENLTVFDPFDDQIAKKIDKCVKML